MKESEQFVYWSTFRHADLELYLLANHRGLCRIALPNESFAAIRQFAAMHHPHARLVQSDEQLRLPMTQLREYFEQERRTFSVPLDLLGTPFQVAVWQQLRSIPYGEVRSYQDVAVAVQRPKAVRAVGAANGRNPIPIVVPCHRVIGKDGSLVGFGGGLPLKERLLRGEGLAFTGGWRLVGV